ncbi:hypothetical protein E7742_03735 [Rhodococcus sp. SGAir0479]|nr:hypothetical protein E7742_03735 [Rhodococcus sp. SGAir0479]
MSFADGAVRTVSGLAEVTTSSIGALGGAAVGSVVGGMRGVVTGVADGARRGLGRGSHSTPAAVLTMAAAGAAGLIEWPVVLTVGGAALVLRQLHERGAQPGRTDTNHAEPAPPAVAPEAAGLPDTHTAQVPIPEDSATTTTAATTPSANPVRKTAPRAATPESTVAGSTPTQKSTAAKQPTTKSTTPRPRGRTAR